MFETIQKIFLKFRKAMQFYNVRVLVVADAREGRARAEGPGEALARGGVTRRRSHELAFLQSSPPNPPSCPRVLVSFIYP